MNKISSIILDKPAHFLSQLYPFYYQGKFLWKLAAILFAMTLSFGYFFEPFEVYIPEHKMDYFWISFIHGCTPPLIVGLFSLFKISPKTEENWTVRKEILLVASFLLVVGITQFLIRDIIYNNPNNWSLRYLYEEIRNTFLVGTLFAIIFTSLNFNRLYSKNVKHANALDLTQSVLNASASPTVFVETQIKNNDFELNIDNLLFAKAEGNYVELYIKEKTIGKVLKRITLKELESILTPYPHILKTHRSYLVNLHHIATVVGNAQGYKLQLNNCDEKVPVSRNMIQQFDTKMNRI